MSEPTPSESRRTNFHVLERRFGRRNAKLCYESHAAAIDAIAQHPHVRYRLRLPARRWLPVRAARLVDARGRICTGVHVTDVRSGTPCQVLTAKGRRITASVVVDARNMAITSRFNIPLREAAYRTYVLAFDVPRGCTVSADLVAAPAGIEAPISVIPAVPSTDSW